jgi:hypothetical protein
VLVIGLLALVELLRRYLANLTGITFHIALSLHTITTTVTSFGTVGSSTDIRVIVLLLRYLLDYL